MRFVVAMVMSAVMLALMFSSAALAEKGRETEPDTISTTTLFNPPRVITPEDTSVTEFQVPPASVAVPQDPTDTQEPKKARRTGKCPSCPQFERSRFGGGAGPFLGYLFADLGEINAKVGEMGIPELSEDILMVGGKGYARIGYLVIGGAGYHGSTETSGIPDGCARYAEVDIAYGGLILGLSKTDIRYEATAGMLFGGGSVAVERRRNSRYVFGWDDSWDIFDVDDPDSVATDDLNITSTLRGDFIALEPFIEIKYRFLPCLAVDFSASYLRANIGRGGSGHWIMPRS
jgi:hypothetical protein